jgi:putative transposase
MTSDYLTVKEVAELMSKAERTIQIRANKESWTYLEENGRARGGKIKKYFLHGLPEEIQLAYNKGIAKTIPGESGQLPLEAGELLPPEAKTAPGVLSPPRLICSDLADWQTPIAQARFDLVTAYVAAKNKSKRKKESVMAAAADFVGAYNTGVPHPKIFTVVGQTSRKTLEKWHHTLKKNGYDLKSLAPKYGQHRKGVRVVTEGELAGMLRFALHPNCLKVSQIIRWTKKTMKKEGTPSVSSDATMRRALNDWKNRHKDRWVFCRHGEKALLDDVLPYLQRDASDLEVGDILVGDGHKLNFRVINPYTGKPTRPILLMFFDWASRHPAGWYIMMTETVQSIHAALRRSIIALGKIPAWVCLDNGKAFRAKFFTKTVDFEQAGIQGLYARLGIRTYFATKYNARAKPVERFFNTFNEMERLLPSYIGASISDKPAYLHRNEKLHKKLHNEYVPTVEQADAIIRSWVSDEYGSRPHRGINGSTPAEIWENGKGPGIDKDGLRYLMMSSKIKKIHRNGVTLFGINYYDERLYGYGKPVQVKHDILDMESVYIYTEDGSEFLCEAKPVRSVHPLARMTGNPLDLENVKWNIKRQRRLKKGTEAHAREMAAQIGPWNFPELEEEKEEALPLSPAQIIDIEKQAAETKVIHLDEHREPDLPLWEGDVYEVLLEKQCAGTELTANEMGVMREYEETKEYRMLKPRYEMLMEQWLDTAISNEQ